MGEETLYSVSLGSGNVLSSLKSAGGRLEETPSSGWYSGIVMPFLKALFKNGRSMKLSEFGKKLTTSSGILQLMDDLGDAMASGGGNMLMLGGGNPGSIPDVQKRFRARMHQILEGDGQFEDMIGNYDNPQGDKAFIEALVGLLNKEFNWDITSKNIVLTNGSQTAFFLIFNMFAGRFADGTEKKILLPLTPEYIGYADVGCTDDFFVSNRPPGEAH